MYTIQYTVAGFPEARREVRMVCSPYVYRSLSSERETERERERERERESALTFLLY